MEKTVDATFDGEVFRFAIPINLPPNTKVKVLFDESDSPEEPYHFLRMARSLKLRGPSDFSENLDQYLYGGQAYSG